MLSDLIPKAIQDWHERRKRKRERIKAAFFFEIANIMEKSRLVETKYLGFFQWRTYSNGKTQIQLETAGGVTNILFNPDGTSPQCIASFHGGELVSLYRNGVQCSAREGTSAEKQAIAKIFTLARNYNAEMQFPLHA